MADHDITLYISEMSPPARCVAYFLKYHKLDSVKIVVVSLAEGENKSEWFMKLNPHGTVPLMRDETVDLNLFESTSILEYLCDLFKIEGTFGLPQQDLAQKYKVINALHNVHNFTVKANWDIMSIWYGAVFGGQTLDLAALRASIEKEKTTRFALLEEILTKNGGFIAGNTATCADLRIWCDLFQLSTLGGEVTLGMVDFSEFPTISAYLQFGMDNLYTPEFWEMVKPYYQWATGLIGHSDFRLAEKKD